MIIVFGNINTHIHMELNTPLITGNVDILAQHSMLDISGTGTIHAVSAARCGAKTALVGTVGNDTYGKHCLETLRREGIQTSGIGKNDGGTGINLTLSSCGKATTSITSTGANQHTQIDQIPDIHLNTRCLLLLSDDLDGAPLTKLTERARAKGATSMVCLQNDDEPIDADIVVTNKQIPSTPDTYFITAKNHGIDGASAVSKSGDHYNYDVPDTINIIDKSGCFDVFCGYLAACIQAGLPMERSITFASKAARITSQKTGIYESIPYLGHLEDIEMVVPKTQNY